MEDHCSGASEQFPWTADETVAAKEKEAVRDVSWRMPLSFPTPHSLNPQGQKHVQMQNQGLGSKRNKCFPKIVVNVSDAILMKFRQKIQFIKMHLGTPISTNKRLDE